MYSHTNDVFNAQFVLVEPHLHKGFTQLCPLVKTPNQEETKVSFEYQKIKYKFNTDKKFFEKTLYPTRETMSYYKKLRGLSQQEVEKAIDNYGHNKFDIPIPTFLELFKEHALAPFFVFQVFCVVLWCLDEYWYYSVFTLVMLFVFESTVVSQRLNNLKQVSQMASEPLRMYVLRNGKWVPIMSDQLVPNDIVSVTKQREGDVCPCDVLILDGRCVVNEALLTGETTPQMKQDISERSNDDVLDIKKDKENIIFGGTRVLLAQPGSKIKSPPDGGCVGVVLRTGFGTNQGKLIRTILFSTERVSANNPEALLFILFLLVFAIIASAYVMIKGLEDPNRSRYKLVLNCILIITSVVPPELPMELSLAVNTSLMALTKLGIFCTEPFRIPFAGKVDVCCFDKTGTLTSDKMILKGITGLDGDQLTEGPKAKQNAKIVLAGCHSLISLEGEVVGDPMEKAGLEGINYKFSNDIATCKRTNKRLKIHKRFAFSSTLKRMSAIIQFDKSLKVVVKGAPEVLKPMFSSIPDDYDTIFKKYTATGSRVIALGIKNVDSIELSRAECESDLTFAGFAIFESDIKPDTYTTIEELIESSHRVIMITGDNPLTAAHVARELNFVTRPVFILSKLEDETIAWVGGDETGEQVKSIDTNVTELYENYDLCICGDAMQVMLKNDPEWLKKYITYFYVFARVSPEQKELITTTYKSLGFSTLMCGDGTNDVGALKQADVGVALLDNLPDAEWQKLFMRSQKSPISNLFQKKEPEKTPEQIKIEKQLERQRLKKLQKKAERQQITQPKTAKTLQQLLEEAQDEQRVVRLGDASIAAPFTSKSSTIMSTESIIKQGRCTLVTTMQMYRILAVNCLISAYSLSVLYLDGVKFADEQMMISGVAIALCFLFISRSKPLDKLSAERPHTRIFSSYMMLSILGQFAIHISSLIYAISAAKAISPIQIIDHEADFEPNIVNTVVFIITSLQTVVTFATNYRGHPFMESLTENRYLFFSLFGLGAVVIATATNLFPELNEALKLVNMPTVEFRNFFVILLLLNAFGAIIYEKIISYLFKIQPKKYQK